LEEDDRTIVLRGTGVSPGVATGKAYVFDRLDAQISFYRLEKPALVAREIKRLRAAVKASEEQLKTLKRRLGEVEGVKPVYIIDVHLMLLRDRVFLSTMIDRIRELNVNAEWAVRLAVDKYREVFEKIEDDYLRERFNDIRYAAQMILRNLAGGEQGSIAGAGGDVIVIAADLSPADTAQMMIDRVLGFATDIGSRTSHTAIVARSLEIPAVVGLEKITRVVRTNDTVIVDGSAGLVIVNPEPEVILRYEEKRRLAQDARAECLRYACLPAVTRDGRQVAIGGNIEFVEEIPSALTYGAEGIGLYRTEFIYVNREQLPTEEDHLSNYSRVIGAEGLSWATVRTFDLGGDKFFSNPKLAKEMNPQMGLRAIRFCLKEIDLFKVQLRAILRASALGRTRILFPMISGVEEIRRAKEILEEVRVELEGEGVPLGDRIEVGAMIEVPSAVMIAEALAREVDYFSIGTNDLIQYVLAIDRINERVSYLYEPLHPAVLRMIRHTVEAGHAAGIPVAMCGEMAGDPLYTMVLLGLDLDELSMNPMAIPKVKAVIRETTMADCKGLLEEIMSMSSGVEIRRAVEDTMSRLFPAEFGANGQ